MTDCALLASETASTADQFVPRTQQPSNLATIQGVV